MVRRFLIDGCCLFGLVCLHYFFVFENELLTRSIVSVGLLFTFFFRLFCLCFVFVFAVFILSIFLVCREAEGSLKSWLHTHEKK